MLRCYSVDQYIIYLWLCKIDIFIQDNTKWLLVILFFHSASSKIVYKIEIEKNDVVCIRRFIIYQSIYPHCKCSFHVRRGYFIFWLQKDFPFLQFVNIVVNMLSLSTVPSVDIILKKFQKIQFLCGKDLMQTDYY